MTLTCNLLAGASLARKTVGYKIWRNTRELCVFESQAVETMQHLALPGPISLGFFTQGAINWLHCGCPCCCDLSLCFSTSLSFSLTEWVSSCWPGRLCGKSGPRLATSEPNPPKPHQAVISGYVPVSDLGLVCYELGRGRHSVGEWEGSHMLAVWTSSPN